MRARWAPIALLSIALLGSAQKPTHLYGEWKVTALATASPVTALGGEAAARLIGQVVSISSDKFKFARKTCHPNYESSKKSLAEIAQDYKVDAKNLKLPDPVLSYDVDCTEVFAPEPRRIVFPWKGYFFEAVKSAAATHPK